MTRFLPRIALLSATILLTVTATPNLGMAAPMTEMDLIHLKKLGGSSASPDGKMIVYQTVKTDLSKNKSNSDIWKIPSSGGEPRVLIAKKDVSEHSPSYSADGKYVYFLSDEGGSDQLWRIPASGGAAKKITNFKTSISGYKFSPDGRKIALWANIARECTSMICHQKGDRATPGPGTGREYDHLFVRHWSSWETPGKYSRIFAYSIDGDGILTGGHAIDATEQAAEGAKPEIEGDSPSKPFGGGEEIAWSADSSEIYYTLRQADRNEPSSTNLDIYRSHRNYASAENITASNKATDTMPAASPDGKWLAWGAMKRPGYESGRLAIMIRNLKSGTTRELAPDWDRSAYSLVWAADSNAIYATATEKLDTPLFRITLDGQVKRLTGSGRITEVLPLADGSLVYGKNSLHAPSELFRMDATGKSQQITQTNRDAMAKIDEVTSQRFDFAGANGDQVWGQIIKPDGSATSSGKLPTLFLVHGGPQGSFGDSWSFRWNPKVMAAQGYVVVTIDFHGSTGYGQSFTDSINRDWGGKPLTDLKLGLAAAAKVDGAVDSENICALGASYGGYMMNWIAGQWPDAFKCMVNHAGLFDLRSFAYSTEELWFDRWDNGGAWDVRKDAEQWNPVNHVSKWNTPTLLIHGEKDFRIPYTQSLMAFTALQDRNIDSKLLIFPDENHWILKPKNSLQWHRTVFGWLEKHLKAVK